MPVAPLYQPTQRVVIYYDDGTSVETDVSPTMAASIARMEWEEKESDRKHRAAISAVKRKEKAKAETKRHNGKHTPSFWDGPRYGFALHLGESAQWAGPASLWLRGDKPCTGFDRETGEPDPAFAYDSDGVLRAVDTRELRCRLCGQHGRHLPVYAVCLNSECSRTGRDKDLGVYGAARRAEAKKAKQAG